MNRFIFFIVFFNVFTSLAFTKEIVILEPSMSPFSKMVEKHVSFLATHYFQDASSHDIQIIVNALLASYQYAKVDLKYETLASKLIANLWKLKNDPTKEEALAKFIALSKKFIRVAEQKKLTTQTWDAIAGYLDAPEQKTYCARIFGQ